MREPAPCIHCGKPTETVTMFSREHVCWPPCAHHVAFLRAALSDPAAAECAAALLHVAGVEVGEA